MYILDIRLLYESKEDISCFNEKISFCVCVMLRLLSEVEAHISENLLAHFDFAQ